MYYIILKYNYFYFGLRAKGCKKYEGFMKNHSIIYGCSFFFFYFKNGFVVWNPSRTIMDDSERTISWMALSFWKFHFLASEIKWKIGQISWNCHFNAHYVINIKVRTLYWIG